MAGPPNELFSAFALVGFLVCAIPFYWHFRARNTGTCLYMFWAGFGCFLHFVNSIIWNKNMINRAPVYCDIVTRIQAGLAVSIPASALCITRKLYKVTKATSARPTREEIRRSTIVDLMIGLGFPILQMALEYVVEGHRYDLFEDFGPFLFVLDTPPAYPLVAVWPLAIGIVSLVYDVLNIFHLWKRGRHLKQMLAKQQGWSPNLYYRLIALSIVDIVVTIPICSYLIWADVTGGNMYKWKSWSDTHADYSKVVQYANVIWKNNPPVHLTLELYRWLFVASALVFFVFFGFADEAREHYRLVYRWFVRRACRLLSLPEPIDQKTLPIPRMSYIGNSTRPATMPPITRGTDSGKRDPVLPIFRPRSLPLVGDASLEDFAVRLKEPAQRGASESTSSVDSDGSLPAPAPAVARGDRRRTPPLRLSLSSDDGAAVGDLVLPPPARTADMV